jgi:predicted dehydrogenase
LFDISIAFESVKCKKKYLILPKTSSMNPNPLKTGLMSFGMSGKVFHAPFLELHPGFELSAVVERTSKQACRSYPNIRSYDSVEELLADSSLELIVVNTPNHLHFEHAMKALQAGKHVLMEKPFATNVEEAKILFETALKAGLYLLPYQNRRYDTDFKDVREVVSSKALGRLVEVHVRFDRYRPEIGPKKFKEEPIPGSGLLFDLGPHLLDQVLCLFGKPDSWEQSRGYFRENTQVDDFANLHLRYADGIHVFVTASMLTAEAPPAYQLFGSKGRYEKFRTDPQEAQLVVGMTPMDTAYGCESTGDEGRLVCFDEQGRKIVENLSLQHSTYLHVFEDVYATVRYGADYPVRPEEILWQLEILTIGLEGRGFLKE